MMEEEDVLPSTSQSDGLDSVDGRCLALVLHPFVDGQTYNMNNLDLEEGKSRSLLSRSSISRQIYPVGAALKNLGNTCFMNAILQCITHTVPFVQKLLSATHPTPCSYEEEGFCIFCALKEHVGKSINESGSVVVPTKFANNLKKILSNYEKHCQEDAQEFLQALLALLDECPLVPSSQDQHSLSKDSIVKQVFGGRLVSQLRCLECGHCSYTFDPICDLSLGINDVESLTDALVSYTKFEKIEGTMFTCEGCNAQVLKEKQIKLAQAPDVVAIQLKRFENKGEYVHKIDKYVEFSSELDLKPYLSCPDEEVQSKYDLYAIVDHMGDMDSGHYDCTIRSSATAWYQLDDEVVRQVTEASALYQSAYLLFYIKQGLSPWFSSLLPAKESKPNSATHKSPTSVLENIRNGHSTYHSEKNEECGPSSTTFVSNDMCDDNVVDKADVDRPQTPPARKSGKFNSDERSIDSVFHDEQLDDDEKENHLVPRVRARPKGNRKMNRFPAFGVNLNMQRLLRGMHSSRRRCILDCLTMTQNLTTPPLGKKKRPNPNIHHLIGEEDSAPPTSRPCLSPNSVKRGLFVKD